MSRVVVVGAGITGLTTAWSLAQHGVEVIVVDPDPRPGGKLRTVELDGAAMDVGADAFVARQPEGRALATAVGLGDDLVAPARSAVWLWRRGRRRPLPPRTLFGVPTDLHALRRSHVLTLRGTARVAVEPLLPSTPRPSTVGELVRRRLGHEAADVLVAPLLAGIYAGDLDDLGLEDAAPQLAVAAVADRSLVRGARRTLDEAAGRDDPVFLTVRGGMERLARRLAAPVEPVTARVVAIEPGRRWTVRATDRRWDAEHVVLTPPTPVAAALLGAVAGPAAEPLGWVGAAPHASVATVALAYDRAAAPGRPRASGVLVPPGEGRLVKAVTLASAKWPHHATHERLLVRASVGRIGDERFDDLDDGSLAAKVDEEVGTVLGLRAGASAALVQRWPRSLPQYRPGHLAAVARVQRRLPAGLHVAGAGWRGVGVTPCVAQALAAAAAILDEDG